jgi:hypothetical protein
MVVRRKTRKGICCAPGRALPSARAAINCRRRSRSVHTTKTQPKLFDENERTRRATSVARVSTAAVVRHSSRFPDVARVVSERLFVAVPRFRSLSFSEPPRASRAQSRLDAGFMPLSFFSPPLVVPARRRFSTKRRFIPPGERARVLVKASARARPQRTTRRFRRTSGRRRRSPRRPTEPPAPGASVSARLLAARRFARVRVGSRVGKRAS